MFNEKQQEYSRKRNKKIPVVQTAKYKESKAKAEKVIGNYKDVSEGDFWILMNESSAKEEMYYSGLIISHNGCLKINDTLDSKFDPECVSVDKEGYGKSLVVTYCNKEQGIYEVGEVSAENCKNAYPYAMAYKRCFDRVVLKLSKLAYAGIYSDSEADEFSKRENEMPQEERPTQENKPTIRQQLLKYCNEHQLDLQMVSDDYQLTKESTDQEYERALNALKLTHGF